MSNFSLKSILSAAAVAVFSCAVPVLAATTGPQPRILLPIENGTRTALVGTRPPLAEFGKDTGRLPDTTPLSGMTLVFNRTAAQQADLDSLLVALQNTSSPLYHQWLTPDQFAARFGTADSDIAQATSWLQSQGFTVTSVSRSRDRIFFSGTAGQVASAFNAPLHNYTLRSGSTQFGPSADLTLPAALAPSILGIGNLSSFRPHNNVKMKPAFTSSVSGSHYVTPGDLATIYDVTPAYSAGYTGINQSIVIIGQTSILQSDIANFHTAAGVTAKAPILVLVPSSGASYTSVDDEGEADLDVEYSSTMAPGAQVFYVYTGNNTNYSVYDALQYAVDERLAPIISSSYGACEAALGLNNYNILNAILAQAATQGQTVLSAAGDSGSTDCQEFYTSGTTSAYALGVDFPGSSQYVTSMGGSEFPVTSTAIGNTTYWAAQGTTDVIASAKSYIPEQVWNDDVAAYTAAVNAGATPGLSSGGGGISIFTARPSWQTGISVGGVALPSGSLRLVPDISLDAANYSAPLLYCGVDQQTGSCGRGFRDAGDTGLTAAGGTSFDGPIFSGLLAVLLQRLNSTGLGVINPTLYSLATSPTTYASAFHDIATGGNQCLSPSTSLCPAGAASTTSYAATTGYDEATGLGSIDFYNLFNAWPKPAVAALPSTITSITAASSTPLTGVADLITITVAPTLTNTKTPTGTIILNVDGGVSNGGTATTLTLVSGVATYSFSTSLVGSHVLNATYSGDTNFGPSAGNLALTASSTLPTTTTSLSAATSTPVAGVSDAVTISVAPNVSNGKTPTGTVSLVIDGGTAIPLTLVSGVVTYSFNSTVLGNHTLVATYSGDTNFSASVGSLALTVVSANTPIPSFTVTASAPTVTVTAGNSASDMITVTPVNGYTGTVGYGFTYATNLTNACISGSPTVSVPGTAGVSMTVTFYTSVTTCNSLGLQILKAPVAGHPNTIRLVPVGDGKFAAVMAPSDSLRASGLQKSDKSPWSHLPLPASLAGLLIVLGLRRRSKLLRSALALSLLLVVSLGGLSLTGCGGGGSVSPNVGLANNTPTGSYLFTLTGTDSVNTSLSSSVSVTLIVK